MGFFRAWRRSALAETLVSAVARIGYGARGAVYLSVGFIALLAATGDTPHAVGAIGALEAWGAWPLGLVLIWIVGLGLYAFAAWRGLQALFDADRLGSSAKAIGVRAGKALSGVIYAGLGVSVFGLLDAMEDLHETDDQAAMRAAVEMALNLPFGVVVVTGAGVLMLVAGAANMVRALFSHFTEELLCSRPAARWAGGLARAGYLARGVAFLPAGVVMISAGLNARAAEARGMGGALEMLKDQPFGHAILGLVGLGLMAFGGFGLLKAAWRRIALEPAAA